MGADAFDRLAALDPVSPDALHVPALADLEAAWEDEPVGAGPGRPRGGARRRRWHGGGFLSVSLAALAATGAAAATLTAVTGNPLGRVESVAVQSAPMTERMAGVTAADPDGGPPWTVRLGAADAGMVCLNVGQLRGGDFGIRGLDGVFRTSAVGDSDQCAARPTGETMLANARTFVGRTSAADISVVYGMVGRNVKRVIVRYPDGAHARLPLDRDGVFVVVRRGSISRTAPNILTSPGRDTHGLYVRMVQFGDPRLVSKRLGTRGVVEKPLDPKEPVR